MGDGFDAKAEGNRIIVLTDMPKLNGHIEIGPDGPPKTVLYGGDEEEFDTAK